MNCTYVSKLCKNLAVKHVHFFLIAIAVASLAVAYIAEYGFHILPCDFCLYERSIYMAIIVTGILSLVMKMFSSHRGLFVQLLILSIGISITFYHVGMEQHWWAGPASCSGVEQAETFEQFRAQLMKTTRPRCDKVTWAIFGISATAWNLMLQGCLAFLTSIGLYLPLTSKSNS